MIGYLQLARENAPIMSIQDTPEMLSTALFCDADFAGDVQNEVHVRFCVSLDWSVKLLLAKLGK